MSTRSVRKGASSATALLLALALAGCGSSESEPAATDDPTTPEPTTEEPTPEPTDEDTDSGGETGEEAPDQEEALDQYVALEQAQVEAALDELADVYSEVSVTAEYPDTVVFSYVYAEQVDPAAAEAELDSMLPTLEALCETRLFPDMEATGVTPTQKATYSYYNADGTELWTHTFESS